jgi:Ca2+-binding RTX toxin-like protein
MSAITPVLRSRLSALLAVTALAATLALPSASRADGLSVPPAVFSIYSCDVSPTIAGTNGNDNLLGTGGADVIRLYDGIDGAQGKGGNDRICGDNGADAGLNGDGGNDIIRGGGGNDHAFSGGDGDDWVFGDAGDDVIGADVGKDHEYGGADNDTIYSDTWGVDGVADADYVDGGPGYDKCYVSWEDTVKNCEEVTVTSPEPPA